MKKSERSECKQGFTLVTVLRNLLEVVLRVLFGLKLRQNYYIIADNTFPLSYQ